MYLYGLSDTTKNLFPGGTGVYILYLLISGDFSTVLLHLFSTFPCVKVEINGSYFFVESVNT